MLKDKNREITNIQFNRNGKWEDIDISQIRIIDKNKINNMNDIQDWFITLLAIVVIILVVIIL